MTEREVIASARGRIEEAQHGEATKMLLEIRKLIVEETISMTLAFDYDGLDEEVAQALLDSSHYGERHREHLTRFARSRVSRFVFVKASG